MYIDYSIALTLFVIGWRNNKSGVKAVGKDKSAESPDPRYEFASEDIEVGWRAEAMERNAKARTVFLGRCCLEVG